MQPEDPRIQLVTMPKWGLSMKVGKVVEWLVEEGDQIAPGADLADIETEKIAGTLESAQSGLLRRIVAAAHADVPVSGVIAIVAPAEVDDAAIEAAEAAARAELSELAAKVGQDDEDAGPQVGTLTSGPHTVSYASVTTSVDQPGEHPDGAPGRTPDATPDATPDDVVVMVHGYGGDRDSWLFVQEPLAAAARPGTTRTVAALDLPGHGASSKTLAEGATLTELADAVLAVVDALTPDGARAHLVGHSLGGAVAAAAAASRPDRVASLTLVAPAGMGGSVDAGYLRGFAAASSRRELKPLLERLFGDPALVTRQLVDDVLKVKRLDGVTACLDAARQILLDGDRQAIDTAATLAGLPDHIPVAIVWGSADAVLGLPPDVGRVRVVEGAGHMVHMEAPHQVLEVIESGITPG